MDSRKRADLIEKSRHTPYRKISCLFILSIIASHLIAIDVLYKSNSYSESGPNKPNTTKASDAELYIDKAVE